MSAMTDPWAERLSEYLDDELGADERTLAEAHISTCASCRDVLTDLRVVAARARSLPVGEPAADLWPGIAARVGALARESAAPARPRRGIVLSWPQLVAAGIALMLVSGGGMWLAGRNAATRGTVATTQPLQTSGGTTLADTKSAAAVDPQYAKEVADLERVLAERRKQLDPETVKTIESNLAIIDQATEQAQRALAADPANPYLKEYLSKSMKKKVELLKQATVLATAE